MPQITQPERPTLTVEPFLKRYKNERRRRKMAPHYQAIITEVDKLCDPLTIHQEFALNEVPELAAWAGMDTCAATLAICTLGSRLDEGAKEFGQDDLLKAVILEEVALAWIVTITRDLHSMIRHKGRERGLIVGPAYRPGVGRWPIETQQTIFTRLPADQIGVTLNEHLLMTPQKSTSLIIPIRKQKASP
jgi:hypothetical protein